MSSYDLAMRILSLDVLPAWNLWSYRANACRIPAARALLPTSFHPCPTRPSRDLEEVISVDTL